jgi:hypothetical protein
MDNLEDLQINFWRSRNLLAFSHLPYQCDMWHGTFLSVCSSLSEFLMVRLCIYLNRCQPFFTKVSSGHLLFSAIINSVLPHLWLLFHSFISIKPVVSGPVWDAIRSYCFASSSFCTSSWVSFLPQAACRPTSPRVLTHLKERLLTPVADR